MLTKKELKNKLIKMGIRVSNDKVTKSSIISALTKIVGKRGGDSKVSLKAPKEWWDKTYKEIKKGNPDYSEEQIRKTIGDIWANKLTEEKKKAIRQQYGKKYGPAKSAANLKIKADPVEDYYDRILKGYLDAMLWAETDDDDQPLDKNYDTDDVAEEVIKKSKEEIKQFCKKAEEAGVDLTQYDTETIGHDLWLTRVGHGSGFWDGGYEGNDGEDGDTLTKITKSFGHRDPYVGDDGKIYLGP